MRWKKVSPYHWGQSPFARGALGSSVSEHILLKDPPLAGKYGDDEEVLWAVSSWPQRPSPLHPPHLGEEKPHFLFFFATVTLSAHSGLPYPFHSRGFTIAQGLNTLRLEITHTSSWFESQPGKLLPIPKCRYHQLSRSFNPSSRYKVEKHDS